MAAANDTLQKARTYLEKGEYTNAEQAYQEVLKAQPGSAEALAELGRFAMMREQVEEGLRLVEQALEIQPKFAQALAYKGLGYTLKEDFAKAIPLFEEAVAINPALVMAWHNLGRAYRKQGDWEKAETSIRKALELNPNHFQAHYELSTILANTNRVTEAIREALESIRINPLFLKGYLTLGKAYEMGGRGDLSIRLYREGLKKNPGALILRQELINLGVLAGDFEGAEKAFQKAAQQKPEAAAPHFNLGEIYSSANLKQEATREYMEAIRLDDRNWKPYNSLGVLHMKGGTPESLRKAVEYFQEAAGRSPQSPEPYYNLALVYGHLKNREAAEQNARLALERIPADGVLKQDVERLLKALEKV